MSRNTSSKVLSIVENIKKGKDSSSKPQAKSDAAISDGDVAVVKGNKKIEIRGQPKSGRFWKSNKERFSSINKTKGLRQDFQKKTSLRLELKRVKELSKQVKEELKDKEVKRKERRRENIKKSEENKRKAEVVQVITNSAKLKRMKKKQLRFIEKRDTNKQVEASK